MVQVNRNRKRNTSKQHCLDIKFKQGIRKKKKEKQAKNTLEFNIFPKYRSKSLMKYYVKLKLFFFSKILYHSAAKLSD